MKRPTFMPLLALLMVFLFSCSSDTQESSTMTDPNTNYYIPQDKIIEIEILELINNHRISLNLSPLEKLDIIKSQAYEHTQYMIENQEVSHANFYLREQFLKDNLNAKIVTENIGYGYSSAASVFTAWLNSDSHRAAIEYPNLTHFDVFADKSADGLWYYTNIFVKI